MVAAHKLYDRFAGEKSGPLGTVRWCRLCDFHIVVRPGRGKGRGFGLREGNKARGAIIRHLHEKHAAEIAA